MRALSAGSADHNVWLWGHAYLERNPKRCESRHRDGLVMRGWTSAQAMVPLQLYSQPRKELFEDRHAAHSTALIPRLSTMHIRQNPAASRSTRTQGAQDAVTQTQHNEAEHVVTGESLDGTNRARPASLCRGRPAGSKCYPQRKAQRPL